MNPHTFMVEKPCPVCLKSSRVIKTRSRLVVEKTDEDFCMHYKDFNPYFYKIWICEHCGFATDEKTFLSKLPERIRRKLWDFLAQKQLDIEFVEERTLPDAIASYQLALSYLDLIEAPPSKKGATNLQLAWIYREQGDKEREEEYMRKAADFYDESIMTERYPIGNLTDTGAMYLVGAIYFRLKDYEKCAQHLSRIIGDQSLRTREALMFDRARDLWSDVREIQKKEKEAEEAAKKAQSAAQAQPKK